MLKTVSSITNAIGALNYKGTWNASTNSPALASGVGTKGDYYVVSVAGSTNLDGETLWGVGDWAVYNGAAWQKVEGGNTINATTVSASTSVTTPIVQSSTSAGTTLKNASGMTCIQYGAGGGTNVTIEAAINMNGANAHIEMSPTGTGHVTIKPTAVGDMDNMIIGATTPLAGGFTTVKAATTIGVGAATPSASGAGITFPATQSASTDANTLDDYQEYTAPSAACTGAITTAVIWKATKVGNVVTLTLPTTTGTASAATNFQYGELLPADFRPSATTAFVSCPIKDADANLAVPGMIFILTSGAIRVYKDATAATNFTAALTAGIGQSGATAVSWTI
jgi:hypothetical protein